jgi:hypothetical protein
MKWKKAFKKIGKSVGKVSKGIVKANIDFAKGGLKAAMDVAHGNIAGAIKDTTGQFSSLIKDVGGGIPGVSSVVDLASGLVDSHAGLIADVGEMAMGIPPVGGLGDLGGSDMLGQLSNLAQVSPDSILTGMANSQDKNGLSGTGQAKQDKAIGKKSVLKNVKAKGIIDEILEMIFGISSDDASTTSPNHKLGGVHKSQ